MFLYGKLGKFLFPNDVFSLKKNSPFYLQLAQKINSCGFLLSHPSFDRLRAGYPQCSAVIMWIVRPVPCPHFSRAAASSREAIAGARPFLTLTAHSAR